MKITGRRKQTAELAIAVLVCCAGQYFLVQPTSRALAKVEEDGRALRAGQHGAGVTFADPSAIEGLLNELNATTDAVEERNRISDDPAAFLQSITAVAGRCGVRMEQLRPMERLAMTAVAQPGAAAPPPTPGAAGGEIVARPAQDTRTTCFLAVTGQYGSIVSFLRSIGNGVGFTTVTQLRIAPLTDAGPGMVSAELQVSQYSFDTGPVRAALNPGEPGAADSPMGVLR
jgi:hypothetical protein